MAKLPKKNTKPIHSVYGKALGYRCPACKVKGYRVPPGYYGGCACDFCDGGRITNKKKWLKIANKIEQEKIEQEVKRKWEEKYA